MSVGLKVGIACSAAALLLAGCHKKPEGQVVATVNGEEITQQELQAEAQAANVPPSADKKQVFPVVLQQVIARKLLDQAAAKKGMDKNADYLVQKKRAGELLLAQMYARQQMQTLSVPTQSDVSQFIAQNPSLFAQRERYTVDQIRFAKPDDASKLKPLATAKTMDQVASVLTQQGIKFERGSTVFDSGSVPPEVMKRILALPPTEPFITPQGGVFTANLITGKSAIAVPAADQQAMATNLVRRQNSEKAISQQLDALKASAKIQYQPGFAPPAGSAAGGMDPASAPAAQ